MIDTGQTCLSVNRQPDLERSLRGEAMYSKGRQEADDGMRYALARFGKIMVLGGLSIWQGVDATRRSIEPPFAVKAGQIHAGNLMSVEVARSHDSRRANEFDQFL